MSDRPVITITGCLLDDVDFNELIAKGDITDIEALVIDEKAIVSIDRYRELLDFYERSVPGRIYRLCEKASNKIYDLMYTWL